MSDIATIESLQLEMKKQEKIIIDGLDKQAKGLQGSAQTASQLQDLMNKAEEKFLVMAAENKALETRLSEMEVKFTRPGFGGDDKPVMATPGQQFILSAQFQGAMDRKDRNIAAHEVKSLFTRTEIESKQIAGATRGDLPPDRAPVWAQQAGEWIFTPGQREIRLFDLMDSAPTGSNNIEYFREVLDESYDGPGSQEEETHEKNQMSINFELDNTPVQTIAGWIPASRQVLSDAPQLQSYIDGRLMYFTMAEAERQLLYGTGLAGQLLGVINTPGVQTIAPVGTQTTLDVLRLAAALIRVQEYKPTAVVLHPNDFAAIELIKDANLRYIWVQVPNGGEMRLWRVPVVESTVINEGQFLMGAFGLGAKIWDRQQATIRVSEHHADFFVENAVAILAEMRLALAVYRPAAFVLGTIGEPASS